MGFLAFLLYALLMNGIPLVEVIVNGRSPAVLLLLYWFETVLLVVTGAIRIVVHRNATQKAGHYLSTGTIADHNLGAEATRRAFAGENAYLKGFLGISVIFTIAHGVFVLLLVFLFRVAGPVTWVDARAALVYTICVQSLFLLWDLRTLRSWTFADLGRSVGTVTLRVLVTQLGLIFGLPVLGMTGSPWGLVGTFIAFRACSDAGLEWMTVFTKRRDLPPGLARVLSRTSKQSTESLEAEFDALKLRGAEVDALVELPIGEARRPPSTSRTH
jgi:hypothetical protein